MDWLAAATLPPDKDEPSVRFYQRQIEATGRAIDALVATWRDSSTPLRCAPFRSE